MKLKNKNNLKYQEYNKFFIFDDNKDDIFLNEDVINKYLYIKGYTIILSTIDSTLQNIFNLHYKDNEIKKYNNNFLKYIKIDRFKFLLNKNYKNTMFIIFLADIIFNYIDNEFKRSDISKKYSLADILSELYLIKSFTYNKTEFVLPLTDVQMEILDLFSIPHPQQVPQTVSTGPPSPSSPAGSASKPSSSVP
jgi:hypothetical protein